MAIHYPALLWEKLTDAKMGPDNMIPESCSLLRPER